jgi:hypothetical protein
MALKLASQLHFHLARPAETRRQGQGLQAVLALQLDNTCCIFAIHKHSARPSTRRPDRRWQEFCLTLTFPSPSTSAPPTLVSSLFTIFLAYIDTLTPRAHPNQPPPIASQPPEEPKHALQ